MSDTITTLPTDILTLIFTLIHGKTLSSVVRRVTKQWNQMIVSETVLWKEIVRNELYRLRTADEQCSSAEIISSVYPSLPPSTPSLHTNIPPLTHTTSELYARGGYTSLYANAWYFEYNYMSVRKPEQMQLKCIGTDVQCYDGKEKEQQQYGHMRVATCVQ